MAVNKTSLSVGEIIYDVLTNDAEVMARANKVFPVVTDKATLPYVAYRRSRLEHNPAKGTQGADTVQIDVLCFAAKYGDGVQLAEAVRQALDGKQATKDTLIMRSCTIAGGEEYYENDAYIQELNFTIKV
ncbi:MAG: DUF3168 domain-containing protein [Elusimicrobiaceae bacterium]|jgi:hypothetical protein|nr:DUF3168 domain-containing protein [Elusimicrobiaceae bacterium]